MTTSPTSARFFEPWSAKRDRAIVNRQREALPKALARVRYVAEHHGLDRLADQQRVAARLRLEHPEEIDLGVLGALADPPMSRAQVQSALANVYKLARNLGAR